MRDYEVGDMVQYNHPQTRPIGLVIDVEYRIKSDDFLVYIMWPEGTRPQALFQKDCHYRGLRIVD